jgi:O-antigen/teichoic acid export membrane protein
MKNIFKFYNHLVGDSLYRNSIYLMLSTAIMAFFGFFFWIINARLFKPEQVGIATTLISVVALITSLSMLGLNNGIIRYLPTSERKNNKINTAFTLVAVASILIALIYLIFVNIFSPKLLFVKENIFFAILFVVFAVFSSLNILSESVFIAYRSTKYILIKNTIQSIVKLALPIFLLSLGAYGIFVSVGISFVVAFVLGLIFLIVKFGYLFRPIINKEVVNRMTKFSLGNYATGFIGGLPGMLLPIIILNNLGARFSAYFYMVLMIANFLYIIPLATSQSLFAEGSYSEPELRIHIKKAVKIISLIMIPAIIIMIAFGKYILLAFGKQYSNEGMILLQLFAISGIFLSINYIGNSIFYIKHKIKLLILVNFINALTILSLSVILVNQNLLGIGVAWLIGQAMTSIIYIFFIRRFIWLL